MKRLLALSIAMLLASQSLSAGVGKNLFPVLLGTWTYSTVNAQSTIRGNIVFHGVSSATIYDNKYGQGTITGSFTSAYHFSGTVTFPNADPTHRNAKIWFDFSQSKSSPRGWKFKGGTTIIKNGYDIGMRIVNGKRSD